MGPSFSLAIIESVSGAFATKSTSLTPPTNRMPLRETVRIRRCSLPVSPIALRTALMWLVSVDSDTIRPSHTACRRSSLVTTCSRLWTRKSSRSNTFGPTGMSSDPRLSSRRSASRQQSSNKNGTFAVLLDKKPRKIQSQLKLAARLFRPKQRTLPELSGARPLLASKSRESHENCHNWRHRPDRNEARGQAQRERPRSGPSGSQHGRQHDHGRGPRKGPFGRGNCRRCREFALLRGRPGSEVFRNVGPQSARRRGYRGRAAPYRAVDCRHRPASGMRLLPRQAGAGEPDQGLENSLHDPARHPVLRIRRRDRRFLFRWTNRPAVTRLVSARGFGRCRRGACRRHTRRSG